jgi:hypothetical protein
MVEKPAPVEFWLREIVYVVFAECETLKKLGRVQFLFEEIERLGKVDTG